MSYGVNAGVLIEVLKEELSKIETRYPSYHNDLLETLAKIIAHEREHQVSSTTVKRNVTDSIEALGTLFNKAKN